MSELSPVRSTLPSVLLLAAAALAACGNDVTWIDGQGTGGNAGKQGCLYGGKSYQDGDGFPDLDGCNSCSCDDGDVMCTAMACVEGCEYNGQWYAVGDSFPAGDDCNECACTEGGSVACTAAYCPPQCEYDEEIYQDGDTFACDGCCKCVCAAGQVQCLDPEQCGEPCVYAGQEYEPGDGFPALDGCNKCVCTEVGVSCTELPCACHPDTEWWRHYVSLDPKECQLIDYGCVENTKGFENECGCGCEQDPACPQFFDCEPPTPCDVEKIKKKCPFSSIAM